MEEKKYYPEFNQLRKIITNMWEEARDNAFSSYRIDNKDQNELVTELDIKLEKYARKKIKEAFKIVDFVWEELDDEININSKYKFIIDPIDWTESYINKEFNSTVCIAIEDIKEWKIIYSWVYDFMKDIFYESNWKENSIFFKKEKITQNINPSDKVKILVSWRRTEVDKIITNISSRENSKNYRVARQYWSIALQVTQVISWMQDIYIRPNKIKTWDIASAINFANNNDDFEITDMDLNEFDFKNPNNWIAIYRKKYEKLVDKIINNY